ncbi:MAG: GMC family oxidoreductase N-terminal domain-containing protein [Gammaproteobacteria bacterium]
MQTTEQYDYIVVGGGSAGCIVAARLADANLGSVLLLEAGDRAEQHPETLSADGFVQAFANERMMLDRLSAPQPRAANRHVYVGTGTGMGGSGAVNGMVYTRGDRRDYEQWPKGWRWLMCVGVRTGGAGIAGQTAQWQRFHHYLRGCCCAGGFQTQGCAQRRRAVWPDRLPVDEL